MSGVPTVRATDAPVRRRVVAPRWQVICWALVIAAPFLVVPVWLAAARHGLAASPGAWLGFAYVSVVSMFLASFAWSRRLAVGGIARVGQLQLLQPFSPSSPPLCFSMRR